MFSNHSWNQFHCSHGFEEDESEVLRLKRLFHENILKAEKENMEIIRKKMLDKKLLDEKEFQFKKATKIDSDATTSKSAAITKLKTVTQRRCVPKIASGNNKNSDVQLPNLHNKPKSEIAKQECQFSTIHFLNHFHSAFISSRKPANLPDRTAKYMPCAIPLAPPTQIKDPVVLNKYTQMNGETVPSSNVALHHLISEDVPRKLTIQVLPSISITGKKPNTRNILVEEVTKRDYFEGDGMKTTILPALSNAEKIRIARVNLNLGTHIKTSMMHDKINQTDLMESNISSCSQTENISKKIVDVSEEKNRIKDIVKEVLLELRLTHHSTDTEAGVDAVAQKDLVSPENDCELDSFLGNADSLSKQPLWHQVEKLSAYTQTSHLMEAFAYPKEQIKEFIQEIISEFQHQILFHATVDNLQAQSLPNSGKVDKEVQTYNSCTESTFFSASKAVQVDMKKDEKTCDAAVNPKKFRGDDISEDCTSNNLSEDAVQHAVHDGGISGATEKSQKLDFLLNSIYERFCLENGASSLYTNPKPRENTSTITTREVSVQFNPVFTLTKSTCTSDVTRIDAAHQCELIPCPTTVENNMQHVSSQTEFLISEETPSLSVPSKVSICIQYEGPALIDSYAQTMESSTTIQPSENSTNTSVSTTPVSDNMFVDDMLSEGEIFLPWNLRLLSGSDKIGMQSSRNDTEANGNSDKEKDYSLSEGEIHPKYFLQMNNAQSSSCDSSVDTCPGSMTHYHSYPYLLQRSPGELNPSMHHCYEDLYRYSSSSLSEGEVRNSSTLSSEGEIRFPSSTLRPSFSPSSIQRDAVHVVHNNSENTFQNHEAEFSSNLSQRSHSSSHYCETRTIGGLDDASLSTVTEET